LRHRRTRRGRDRRRGADRSSEAIEGGNHLYRIKCVTEAFERVAKESQLDRY